MRRLSKLPIHVAFITDGNRRWARKKGLPVMAGHEYSVTDALEPLVFHAIKRGIKYLTFWIFSTENWSRGKRFAGGVFSLVKRGMKTKAEEYHKKGIKFRLIGDLSALPKNLVEMLSYWQKQTRDNKKITVTMAINYGGRDEILRAVNRLRSEKKNKTDKVTMEEFEKYLDTQEIPDPDMIIRTGGEKRLSGFLLWQSQYAELYFTETLFPDFNPKEFEKALGWYEKRNRRFGR